MQKGSTMSKWIANMLWDALAILSTRAHDWAFDATRHARIRMKHRNRWWDYHCRAEVTKSKRDDMRARAWQIEFDFKTSPDDAVRRGDLDPAARAMAMASVARMRAER
jgi:hypothetical protein